MSWTAATCGAYDVFFNRDELHTRAAETPPQAGTTPEGTRFLAPRDGDHGGTWLLVNDSGLTLGLLNDYSCAWRPSTREPPLSRGRVLLACAGAASVTAVGTRLRDQPLARALPFHVLVVSPHEPPRVWHWPGTALVECPAPAQPAVLSSSSLATREVIAARIARVAAFVAHPAQPGPGELEAYHHQHDTHAGAHSVLMWRPDAATRSLIHVRVDAAVARLDYACVTWDARTPRLAWRADSLPLARREFSAGAGCPTRVTTP